MYLHEMSLYSLKYPFIDVAFAPSPNLKNN